MTKRRGWLDVPLLAVPLSWGFWAACVLIVIAWTPIVAVFRAFTFRSDVSRRRVGRLHLDSASLAVRINPFWDFHAIDAVHPDASRPCLFVSNHKSLADPFLLTLLPWDMKFLSKLEIFKIPLLGWQMRVAGHIPISRGDRESARGALFRMRERLLAKTSVLLFPEGTRSEDGSLRPFKEGGFRLAIELGVPVVPLAVRGTETRPAEALADPAPDARERHRACARRDVGPSPEDAPALAERVRAAIGAELGREPERG